MEVKGNEMPVSLDSVLKGLYSDRILNMIPLIIHCIFLGGRMWIRMDDRYGVVLIGLEWI